MSFIYNWKSNKLKTKCKKILQKFKISGLSNNNILYVSQKNVLLLKKKFIYYLEINAHNVIVVYCFIIQIFLKIMKIVKHLIAFFKLFNKIKKYQINRNNKKIYY